MFNPWGYILIGLILVMIIITILVAYKKRKSRNLYSITEKEIERYIEDSIAIQPDNTTIFKDRTIDGVIITGIRSMNKDNYRMLKGVNMNDL